MRILNYKSNKISFVIKILYVFVLAGVIVLGVLLAESEDFDQVRPMEGVGEYLVHAAPLIPRETPDMLIAEDNKLFLFYEDTELVNVYSLAGYYMYGFQFPDWRNGESDMHYEDGLLYVSARGSGIYVFKDTQLLQFEEQHYQNTEHSRLEAVFTGKEDHIDGEDRYVYVEKTNTVIRTSPNGSETVMQFPCRRFDPVLLAIVVLLILCSGRLVWSKKLKSTPKE